MSDDSAKSAAKPKAALVLLSADRIPGKCAIARLMRGNQSALVASRSWTRQTLAKSFPPAPHTSAGFLFLRGR
jgi:hypothetical protein